MQKYRELERRGLLMIKNIQQIFETNNKQVKYY